MASNVGRVRCHLGVETSGDVWEVWIGLKHFETFEMFETFKMCTVHDKERSSDTEKCTWLPFLKKCDVRECTKSAATVLSISANIPSFKNVKHYRSSGSETFKKQSLNITRPYALNSVLTLQVCGMILFSFLEPKHVGTNTKSTIHYSSNPLKHGQHKHL